MSHHLCWEVAGDRAVTLGERGEAAWKGAHRKETLLAGEGGRKGRGELRSILSTSTAVGSGLGVSHNKRAWLERAWFVKQMQLQPWILRVDFSSRVKLNQLLPHCVLSRGCFCSSAFFEMLLLQLFRPRQNPAELLSMSRSSICLPEHWNGSTELAWEEVS